MILQRDPLTVTTAWVVLWDHRVVGIAGTSKLDPQRGELQDPIDVVGHPARGKVESPIQDPSSP